MSSWVRDTVFYQVFPDRFARSDRVPQPSNLQAWEAPPTPHGYKGGDLLGIAERLDWLVDLGVTGLYLNPIFRSASNHRYHTHDYHRVDPLLGGDEAFRELLDACHDRGIRVVLDGVFNHASRGFFQFHDILENGRESPWLDWFVVRGWPLRAYDPGRPPNYEAWWDLPALPAFNTDHPEVREFLMGIGERWVAEGIDGWRLDVPTEITTPGFWEEFRRRVRAVDPDCYLVGEIWEDASEWIASGERFDGTMNYLFAGATIAFVAGERVDRAVVEGVPYRVSPPLDAGGYGDAVDRLLALYPARARDANLNLLGSHDTPRLLTVAGGDRASVILGHLLLLTFPGAPCVYYGDEVGMPGGPDPDNRRGFPWGDPGVWDREILEAIRSLVALRKAHPALRSGEYRRLWPPPGEGGSMLYVFLRRAAEESVLVAVNAGGRARRARVDLPSGERRLLWGRGEMTDGEVSVPARAGALWAVGS